MSEKDREKYFDFKKPDMAEGWDKIRTGGGLHCMKCGNEAHYVKFCKVCEQRKGRCRVCKNKWDCWCKSKNKVRVNV